MASLAIKKPDLYLDLRRLEEKTHHQTSVRLSHKTAVIAKCSCSWSHIETCKDTADQRDYAWKKASDAAEAHWRAVRI